MADGKGFEDSVLEAIGGQTDSMIDAIAGTMGLPPGAKRYTRQEQIDEWNFSPITDPQERMNKAVELHMQGATGSTITDFLYPNVRKLIGSTRIRPDEQIQFAREMRKAVGWPDAPDPLDDTGLPIEMQMAMAGGHPDQQPALPPMDPMAAQMPPQMPMQPPAPVAPPVPAPMANPMQPQPAPIPWNPIGG